MCGKGAEIPLLQIGFVAPRPHNAVSHDRRGLMLGPTVQKSLFSRLVEMIPGLFRGTYNAVNQISGAL